MVAPVQDVTIAGYKHAVPQPALGLGPDGEVVKARRGDMQLSLDHAKMVVMGNEARKLKMALKINDPGAPPSICMQGCTSMYCLGYFGNLSCHLQQHRCPPV